MEDLVVGLLVDAIGDLLVVLVTEASLVGGVVNLCIYCQHCKKTEAGQRGGHERVLTCLSAKPWAALLPLRESLALSMSPDMFVVWKSCLVGRWIGLLVLLMMI